MTHPLCWGGWLGCWGLSLLPGSHFSCQGANCSPKTVTPCVQDLQKVAAWGSGPDYWCLGWGGRVKPPQGQAPTLWHSSTLVCHGSLEAETRGWGLPQIFSHLEKNWKNLSHIFPFVVFRDFSHMLSCSLSYAVKLFQVWEMHILLITQKHKHSSFLIFFELFWTLEAKQHHKLCANNLPTPPSPQLGSPWEGCVTSGTKLPVSTHL